MFAPTITLYGLRQYYFAPHSHPTQLEFCKNKANPDSRDIICVTLRLFTAFFCTRRVNQVRDVAESHEWKIRASSLSMQHNPITSEDELFTFRHSRHF